MLTENKKSTYIIGEIGLCHNGSLEIAHELIDHAHNAGIDAVKFQKRTVDLLATQEELNKIDDRFPFLGKTYGEIRRSLEFDKEQFLSLKKHSKDLGLDFIITPFDNVALDFILEIGVDAVKLASHSLTNLPLLHLVSRIKEPVIFSTGMSTFDDIDAAFDILNKHRDRGDLSVLHCVSSYPTPIDECQLHFIEKLKNRYHAPIGYSGHEIGFLPSLMAVAMGAKVVERHITLDNEMEGFDHRVALNPKDLKELTTQIRNFESMYGDPELTRNVTSIEQITSNKYHVSAISSGLIKKGQLLDNKSIIYKNPGTGIPPKSIEIILNKTAKYDIEGDTLLTVDMFE